ADSSSALPVAANLRSVRGTISSRTSLFPGAFSLSHSRAGYRRSAFSPFTPSPALPRFGGGLGWGASLLPTRGSYASQISRGRHGSFASSLCFMRLCSSGNTSCLVKRWAELASCSLTSGAVSDRARSVKRLSILADTLPDSPSSRIVQQRIHGLV